ncbi:UDP-N-acetylmuramoyl-L-alanyl-D-glutamate--2,6-diaminopimelate ligase [Candidatus Sumerlaeota bacterium]|nr:UDP-N-acetylmuramoyl-L-alanyl-D-glutamate--2,6-diaminopimelate ligase [Candidatus Sumerlaeota bacterium]
MTALDKPHSLADSLSDVHPRTLGEWFASACVALPPGANPDLPIESFEEDSRAVRLEGAFIAVRGEAVDGHRFIPSALEAGAAIAICETPPEGADPSRIVRLDDTRSALGRLAHAWWDWPTRDMKAVGVTGTNGKTTTAYLIESVLRRAGLEPALFGTVEYRFSGHTEPAPTTTPGALYLARMLARAHRAGARSLAMEVSSHALWQRRVEAIDFDVALMTNLTQDHLDYHRTMEEYAEAKRLLFTRCRPRAAAFNLDDATARRFSDEFQGRKYTFSLDPAGDADIVPERLDLDSEGVRMRVRAPDREPLELRSALRGRFNASNLLAALSAAVALDLDSAAIVEGLESMRGAPGRFEAVETGRPFTVYVDYAHTPDAVERILENVRAITRGRVIVVLGCGGDRDPGKRPLMGEAMGRLADYSILTSDNPRSEPPERIAQAMEEGIRRRVGPQSYEVCLDRREAIRRALSIAQPGDSVVIAGKGHESYQIVGGETRHFDDREVVRELCAEMSGSRG